MKQWYITNYECTTPVKTLEINPPQVLQCRSIEVVAQEHNTISIPCKDMK